MSKYTPKDVTVIMYSYNTLAETMVAYRNVRKFYETVEFILVDDGSTDGTEDWAFGCLSENGNKIMGQIDLDDYFRAWKNTTKNPLGCPTLLDIGIKMSNSSMVSIFKYGIILNENYIENLLNQWKQKTFNIDMLSKKDYLIKGKSLFI